MERFSSHVFVLDPTVKSPGAKNIGFIGNKLMTEASETTFDMLVNKRSMRLDSFGVGTPRLGTIMQANFDVYESSKELYDLKRALIDHKDYCALRLQRLAKTKKHLNLVGN